MSRSTSGSDTHANICLRVIGAAMAQLVLVHQLRDKRDTTFEFWSYQLATQIAMSLSVITACVPHIRDVLVGFESGMFQTGDFSLKRLAGSNVLGKGKKGDGDSKNTTTTAPSRSTSTKLSRVRQDERVYAGEGLRLGQTPYQANTTIAAATTPDELWDVESQSSQARIIRTTMEWTVKHTGEEND